MSSIPEDWSSLSAINPEFKELLTTLPPNFQLVTESTTIDSLRAMGEPYIPSEKWRGIRETDIMVKMRDGHENRIRSYIPQESQTKGPLLVMIHGGGFCIGRLENVEKDCRKWVRNHGGSAVSIGHRLGPEVKFPVPTEDCYDSFKWIASNAETLKADPAKGFIIGGISSGATATMVASHLYRDEGLLPPLTGIYLCVPFPCFPSALPEPYASDKRIISWEQNANAPIFSTAASKLFIKSFPAPLDHPQRSAFLWPTGHANLPPTYFQVAGMDLSRDYTLLLDEVLREQGVKTKIDLFPGLPHAFWTFFPKAEFAKDLTKKTETGLEWLLEEGKTQK